MSMQRAGRPWVGILARSINCKEGGLEQADEWQFAGEGAECGKHLLHNAVQAVQSHCDVLLRLCRKRDTLRGQEEALLTWAALFSPAHISRPS